MQPSSTTPGNRLAGETSPYLLQHAGNPVDWYPWGEAALQRARHEDKPILLSIGYSACHWCHVMAHESFEDPTTAALMNQLFINIKVDREERPDLDKIYQLAHQILTRANGGWPLTVFLSPHTHLPFFSGTYFPKEPRYGMPAFTVLLHRVSEFYHTRKEDIAQQGLALQEAFSASVPPGGVAPEQLTTGPVEAARERLAGQFDAQFGGFGGAPKFPHPTHLEFLLRQWRTSADSDAPDLQALYMVSLTLQRMAEGGLYDQLGGGFARYSVDEQWMIPHFEKMLYDNAQLLRIYANAALATGEPLFSRIATETADWILRDMQSPTGGYWAALDADSEGHEGKFYVWDRDEVRHCLPELAYPVATRYFGLDQAPNFEGRWHLHVHRPLQEVATQLGLSIAQAEEQLTLARRTLLQVRNARTQPGRDDKILLSWNALTIAALADAGCALQRPDYVDCAVRAVDFIREHMWGEGRLLATYKDGRSRFPAYLDDHAFLLDALLVLLQTRWRSSDLQMAADLAEILLTRFEDPQAGGFFFTAADHEQLPHRFKTFADEAVPAGNAVAAQALNRLGLLIGEPRYLDAAARIIRAAWAPLQHYPHAHTGLLIALAEHLAPPTLVIVRGPQDEAQHWRDVLTRLYAPNRLVFAIPADAAGLPQALAQKRPLTGTAGYVCRGLRCLEPVNSLAALLELTR